MTKIFNSIYLTIFLTLISTICFSQKHSNRPKTNISKLTQNVSMQNIKNDNGAADTLRPEIKKILKYSLSLQISQLKYEKNDRLDIRNISFLPKGIYIIRLIDSDGENSGIRKFVK